MERLKIVLLIATLVATAQTSRGQLQPPGSLRQAPSFSSQAGYVVIGDVRTHYFILPSDTRTTVHQAVLKAGLLSDAVTVSVLRGTQESALWTQMMTATSKDSGELVMEGDILAVQSMKPIPGLFQKNASVRSASGVFVVALPDETVPLGDVLEQTRNLPAPGQQARIVCRFQGRPTPAKTELTDRVEHGDVITVGGESRKTLRGFGTIAPAFSEWSAAASPVIQSPATTDQAFSDVLHQNGASLDVFPANPVMQIPEVMNIPLEEPVESYVEIQAPSSNISPNVPETAIPLRTVSQANPQSSITAMESAPEAPIEVPIPDESVNAPYASSIGAWNVIFIGGLLLAGTLILASSLRADDENVAELDTTEHRNGQEFSNSSAVFPQTPLQLKRVPIEAVNIEELEGKQSNRTAAFVQRHSATFSELPAASLSGVGSSPVANHEWFGGDWRVVQQGTQATEMPGTTTWLAEGETKKSEASVLTSQTTPSPGYLMEAFVADSLNETKLSAVELTPSETTLVASTTPDTDPSCASLPTDVKKIAPTSKLVRETPKDFTDLEDLLQNRLPIDLCETRLPLRISLFGRPAGPRRLRIDAAHSKLAGPHMNMSGERKREEPVSVSAAKPASEDLSPEAAGSLDRALHFLQDRTES